MMMPSPPAILVVPETKVDVYSNIMMKTAQQRIIHSLGEQILCQTWLSGGQYLSIFILQPWRKIDFPPQLRHIIWAEAIIIV